MRSALLFGRDHHTLGALAAIAEGPAAITLSRGGFAKQYEYTEPNEDAAAFAHDLGGTFVAVADGHHGASGARAVLEYLHAEWAPRWTGVEEVDPSDAGWRAACNRALAGANHALMKDAADRSLPPAPTTLALAVVRPRQGLLLWAGIGDSHVFAIDEPSATDVLRDALAHERRSFLGYEAVSTESVATRSAAGSAALSSVRAVVLATDGLSERGIGVPDPAETVRTAAHACAACDPERRPLELARRVSTDAMAAHRANASGDNVASAVIWSTD